MVSDQKAYSQLSQEKVFSSIVDVIFSLDKEGIFRFVSPTCIELFGYTQREMINKSFLDFIFPGDIEKTIQVVADRTPGCKTSNFENRYFRKDGSLVPIIWSGRWDENDGLLYCVARDGSEKQVIEQRLLTAQQVARVANYEFDVVNDCYTYTSDTIFDIFGLDKNKHPQFTGDLFDSLLHPDDIEILRQSIHNPDHYSSSTLEYRIIRPNGDIVYINRVREVIRDSDGKPLKYIGMIQDITDRKISELTLKQSEERFRSLVQYGNDLIGIIDLEGTYTFVGENVEELLGFKAEDLVGKKAFEFIHPDDCGWVGAELQQILSNSSITVGPFRFKNKEGEWRWVETTVSNHLSNPAIAGLVVNSKDITEKRKKEEERSQYIEELRKLSLIAKETSSLVIIQNKERKILWVNHAFTKLTGYQLEECIGKGVDEICDGPETDPGLRQFIEQKLALNEPFTIEAINYKKNGDTYWSDISCQPVINEEGKVVQYFSIATDITQRKLLEERLEKEQKKRQLEIAAATLRAQEKERTIVSQELHDNVNQVLTIVKLYTELCRDGFDNSKEMMNKSINLIQESIDEIRSLSKRLSAPSLGKIKLSESVQELVEAIAATNRFRMQLDITAIDQLEVGQEIHLAVYRILQEHLNNIIKHAGAKQVEIRLESENGVICLQVTDDGQGFDLKKKRYGIGITNMITRAESLNGSLNLYSKPGEGTVLKMELPFLHV